MSHSPFVKYASVVLDVSIGKTLDYGMGADEAAIVKRGMRVEVPIRGHMRPGYVFEVKEAPDFTPVKPLGRVVPEAGVIAEDLFELALWMAKYYCCPLRDALKAVLPASVRGGTQHKQQLYVMRAKTKDELREVCVQLRGKHNAQAAVLEAMLPVKKGILLTELLEITGGSRSPVDALAKKGMLTVDIVRVDRSPLMNEEYFQTKEKKLNPDQEEALGKITATLDSNVFGTHLLYGVTGSGKTEVYLQAISHALKQGRGAIMLVPEISLTAQTIERFRSRFEGHIAILHHRLSSGERYDEWHKIQRGEAKIVIGARSAIFSPVARLGLIIVDEEHEHSYKQSDDMPCYNARDVAVMRGKMGSCAVILGSATPSLESYYNAKSGKYILSKLTARADAASMPQVTIVNMAHEYDKAKGFTSFSDQLLEGIKKRQQVGEQTILFLNRRGYHTTLFCGQCSEAVRCNHCDAALTFHKHEDKLSCHLCGFTLSPPPRQCPKCKGNAPMKYRGVGTEQIQKALHAILPDIRTIRIDADTTRHKGSHQRLLRDFGTGKADVLIGTQMIAKGLHFPEVTLVGVLNSDASLNIPDFRASETVFQLITQVAGRAGRGAVAGEVLIQTCMPDNLTIQLAARQDFEAFYEEEVAIRKLFAYPPFTSMAKITFSGKVSPKVLKTAQEFRQGLIPLLPPEFELNPVLPSGHAKVKDNFRFQFLIRGPGIYPLNRAITQVLEKGELPSAVKAHIDINPTSTYF